MKAGPAASPDTAASPEAAIDIIPEPPPRSNRRILFLVLLHVLPGIVAVAVPIVSVFGQVTYIGNASATMLLDGMMDLMSSAATQQSAAACRVDFSKCTADQAYGRQVVVFPYACVQPPEGLMGRLSETFGFIENATTLVRNHLNPEANPDDPPQRTAKLEMAVIVQGSVDDFTPTVQTELRENVANNVGADLEQVQLTVSAGSVRLLFEITGLRGHVAELAQASLSEALASPEAASTFLSVASLALTVTAIESLPMVMTPPASPPYTAPDGDLGGGYGGDLGGGDFGEGDFGGGGGGLSGGYGGGAGSGGAGSGGASGEASGGSLGGGYGGGGGGTSSGGGSPDMDSMMNMMGRRLDDETSRLHDDSSLVRIQAPRRAQLHASRAAVDASRSVELVVARHEEDLSWLREVENELPNVRIFVYDKSPSHSCTAYGLRTATCISVPNVGLEAFTYLHHITTRYDRLADKTVFVHNKPTPGFFGHRKGGGHMMPLDDFLYDYLRPAAPPRYVPTFARGGAMGNDSSMVFRLALSDPLHGGPESLAHANSANGPSATCPASDALWSRPIASPWDAEHLSKHVVEPHGDTDLKSFWSAHLEAAIGPFRDPQIYAQGCVMSVGSSQITAHPRAFYEGLLKTTSRHVEEASAYYLELAWGYIFQFDVDQCIDTLPSGLSKHSDARVALARQKTASRRDVRDDDARADAGVTRDPILRRLTGSTAPPGPPPADTLTTVYNRRLVMELCGDGSAPPPPPPQAPPSTSNDGMGGMGDMTGDMDMESMMGDMMALSMSSMSASLVGCRVDKMLGTEMPTCFDSWVALLFIVSIQMLSNIKELIRGLIKRCQRKVKLNKLADDDAAMEAQEKAAIAAASAKTVAKAAKAAKAAISGSAPALGRIGASAFPVPTDTFTPFDFVKEYFTQFKVVNMSTVIITFTAAMWHHDSWSSMSGGMGNSSSTGGMGGMGDMMGGGMGNSSGGMGGMGGMMGGGDAGSGWSTGGVGFDMSDMMGGGNSTGGGGGMGDMSGGGGMSDMSGGYDGQGTDGHNGTNATGDSGVPAPDCIGAFVYDNPSGLLFGLGTKFGGSFMFGDFETVDGSVLPDTGLVTFIGMLARAPLSPRLSVIWMMLIYSIGMLIRNVDGHLADLNLCDAAGAPVKRSKFRKALIRYNLYKAMLMKWLLVPIACFVLPFVFIVFAAAAIAAIYMIDLAPIWIVLMCIAAVRIPIAWLWERVGFAALSEVDMHVSEEVDYSGHEKAPIHKWLLWMAESHTFKHYFTCYLHIARVVLQIFVMRGALQSINFSWSEVNAKLLTDYFFLSSSDLSSSLAAIDFSFWLDFSFDWGSFDINLDFDKLLTQIAKVSYSAGFLCFFVEQVMDTFEQVAQELGCLGGGGGGGGGGSEPVVVAEGQTAEVAEPADVEVSEPATRKPIASEGDVVA